MAEITDFPPNLSLHLYNNLVQVGPTVTWVEAVLYRDLHLVWQWKLAIDNGI